MYHDTIYHSPILVSGTMIVAQASGYKRRCAAVSKKRGHQMGEVLA